MMSKDKKNSFLIRNPENGDFNQYWYSPKTIQFIVSQLKSQKALKIAFLSTPSIYFSLDDEELKKNSKLFEVYTIILNSFYFFFKVWQKVRKRSKFYFLRFCPPGNSWQRTWRCFWLPNNWPSFYNKRSMD